MTDRIRHLVVTLDRDVREDDLEALIAAIVQLRGISSVKLGDPVGLKDWSAREVVRVELRDLLNRTINTFFDDRNHVK